MLCSACVYQRCLSPMQSGSTGSPIHNHCHECRKLELKPKNMFLVTCTYEYWVMLESTRGLWTAGMQTLTEIGVWVPDRISTSLSFSLKWIQQLQTVRTSRAHKHTHTQILPGSLVWGPLRQKQINPVCLDPERMGGRRKTSVLIHKSNNWTLSCFLLLLFCFFESEFAVARKNNVQLFGLSLSKDWVPKK